jgi:hypothetical protein
MKQKCVTLSFLTFPFTPHCWLVIRKKDIITMKRNGMNNNLRNMNTTTNFSFHFYIDVKKRGNK